MLPRLSLQYCLQMSNVLVSAFVVYQNVMYKHHKHVQMEFKTLVHRIHKSHRGTGQTKWHHHEFVVTISGSKCELRDIFRVMSWLSISKPQVKLGGNLCTLQLIK